MTPCKEDHFPDPSLPVKKGQCGFLDSPGSPVLKLSVLTVLFWSSRPPKRGPFSILPAQHGLL